MDNRKNIEIVYKSKSAVVIYKPPLVPSQPDKSGMPDALTLAGDELTRIGEPRELYLINRLDSVVGGLILAARTSAAASVLSCLVADGSVTKEYFAVTDGIPEDGVLIDYLSKDSRINKAIVNKNCQNGAKYAELHLKRLASVKTAKGTKTLIRVRLITGRFHQIRAQLSSRATPLVGDKKYGSRDFGTRTPALFASFMSVELNGEHISAYKLPPTDSYPWNLFDGELYKNDIN